MEQNRINIHQARTVQQRYNVIITAIAPPAENQRAAVLAPCLASFA